MRKKQGILTFHAAYNYGSCLQAYALQTFLNKNNNEFEIIKPTGDIDAYMLCFLLKTSNVMVQIESMTSGTSSSHSRIKREQLGEILLPVPVADDKKKICRELGKKIERAINEIYQGENIISEQQRYLSELA